MFDFLQFIYELRHKPLGFIVLAAIIFIVDRLFRNLITSQVKRLFKVNQPHELAAYEERQIRIEQMLQKMMQKEGITWTAPISETRHQVSATRNAGSSVLQLAMYSIARVAGKFTNWRLKRMSNINKAILLPLLSAIALFVKQAYGYEIPEATVNVAADGILYLFMLIGLFMNFTKKKKTPKQKEISNDDFTTPIEPRV